MKRRTKQMLSLVAAIGLAVSVCACSQESGDTSLDQESETAAPAAADDAPDGFDWKKYEGTTIVASVPNNVHFGILTERLPEFTEQTGIKVELDVLANNNLHDKQLLEFGKAASEFDVVAYIVTWKSEYNKIGALEILDPYFGDPSQMMPDYDLDDINASLFELAGAVDGIKEYLAGPGSSIVGVPFGGETSLLAYRKDVFEKHGLQVPETYEELLELCRVIPQKEPGMYGLSMRTASGGDACHAWFTHGGAFGAQLFDENYEPICNNAQSMQTLEFMREVVQAGPPGASSFDIGTADNAFLQGLTAMYLDRDKVIGMVDNPDQSQIGGQVGYAVPPSGTQLLTECGGFAAGIPANSQNKEAAFLFLQWMTSKEIDKKIALRGATPCRTSTLQDADVLAAFPAFAVVQQSLAASNPDWRPLVSNLSEIQAQHLGVAISQVMTGEKEPQEAMDAIVQPIRDIMVRDGYILS